MAKQIKVTPEQVVESLNQLLALDPKALSELLPTRVVCNKKLANHPTMQVRRHLNDDDSSYFTVGLMGIINSMFGIDEDDWGTILCETNKKSGVIERFSLVTQEVKDAELDPSPVDKADS